MWWCVGFLKCSQLTLKRIHITQPLKTLNQSNNSKVLENNNYEIIINIVY